MVVNAVKAVAEFNADIIESVIDMKKEITAIINPAAVHSSKRLMTSEPS